MMQKKVSKPKATTHFKYDHKKANLPVNATVQMVTPTPEEDLNPEDATPPLSEDSDRGESYEVAPDDASISTRDIEVAARVAHVSEAFSGKCFHCGKVGLCFRDEECEMYDPDFLNLRGACKDQPELTGPQGKEDTQASRGQGEPVGNACFDPNA